MNLEPAQRRVVAAALAAGAQDAAERLAKATKKSWSISSDVLSDGPADRFRLMLGGTVQPHLGALLPEKDRKPIVVVVIFPAQSARRVVDDFVAGFGAWLSKIKNVDEAAIGELANIVANALTARLADALGTLIELAPAQVATATRLQHLENALARFEGKDCFMMVGRLELRSDAAAIEGYAAFVVERAFLAALLEKAPA